MTNYMSQYRGLNPIFLSKVTKYSYIINIELCSYIFLNLMLCPSSFFMVINDMYLKTQARHLQEWNMSKYSLHHRWYCIIVTYMQIQLINIALQCQIKKPSIHRICTIIHTHIHTHQVSSIPLCINYKSQSVNLNKKIHKINSIHEKEK